VSGDPYTEGNYRPMTPVDCERELARLKNAIAQAELLMRERLTEECEARLALERAHLIASTDPDCPRVERGVWTVAERDDWIRGQEFDELDRHERAKKDFKLAQRYQERLEQQVSITQTQAKFVLQAYQVMGNS
jgi:hypothetical protein